MSTINKFNGQTEIEMVSYDTPDSSSLDSSLLTNFCGINDANKVRITYINGINTTQSQCRVAATLISDTHGHTKVYYLPDETEGIVNDVKKVANMMLFEKASPTSQKLVDLWRLLMSQDDMQEGGMIYHVAHSAGGLVTKYALQSLTPLERKRIEVVAVGSPVADDKIINYVNPHDRVPTAARACFSTSSLKKNNDVNLTTKKSPEMTQSEHAFVHYASILRIKGQEFVEKHIKNSASS